IKSNGEEHPEKGKLVFFDRAVSAKTGTMRLRAEFPNPTELLRPGMFGRVRFEGGTRKGIQVPQRAIVELQGKAFVWILNQDQTVNQRAVKLGDQIESNIAVLEGLKPGDRIIAEGIHKVREGGKVNAQTAGPAADAAAGTQPKQP
ncbi:MAG: acriflavine resistance protein, partial [Verrucomicrobiota bacterium]